MKKRNKRCTSEQYRRLEGVEKKHWGGKRETDRELIDRGRGKLETAQGRVRELKTGLESGRDKQDEAQSQTEKEKRMEIEIRGKVEEEWGGDLWQIEKRRDRRLENGV